MSTQVTTTETRPKRPGRPRTRTREQRAEQVREAMRRYRQGGMRFECTLSVRAGRRLDALCTRCNHASRRELLEALADMLAEMDDVSPLAQRVQAMRRESDDDHAWLE